MLIKKYVAATMNEALAQVKADLGEDAVILQSRKLDKGGLLGLSGKHQVEVTAATPDRHPMPKPSSKPASSKPEPKRRRERIQHETLAPPPALLGIREYAQQTGKSKDADEMSNVRTIPISPRKPDGAPKRSQGISISQWGSESAEDGETVKDLRSEIETLKGSIRDLAEKLARQDIGKADDGLDMFREALRKNGCSLETTASIVDPLSQQLDPKQLEDLEGLETRLHELIASKFKTSRLDNVLTGTAGPQLIAVVGPTGVGKTTTLAKMATNFDVLGRRKVALISTDTYRVAAVEQLRTFAGIAGLPLEVVYRAEELPAAIERYRDYDVLLLDTAGRSQNDEEALAELTEFIEHARPARTILTLSANMRLEDQREVIANYRKLRFSDVIITKLDEVSSAGHLIDMCLIADNAPWMYLTTGQSVPDDILQADPFLLAAMVVRREYFLHLREQAFQMSAQ